MANEIVEAWKCTPCGPKGLVVSDPQVAFVVRYADGTGNIVVAGKPTLVDGVEFSATPGDFLATCKPFYKVRAVKPSSLRF